MAISCHTTLRKGETKDVAGIVVPEDIILELGSGKRPAVKVTLAGYTYRTTVGKMGDTYMIPLSSEHRKKSGLIGNESLEVTLELDTEPRVTAIPDDLQSALVEAKKLHIFEAMAPSRKKEFVRQVEEAKAPETRLRRIDKVLSSLD